MKLLPKIARGDIQALELLYERHKTRVYRLALSLTADPWQAEDITQETFLRIQERAASYRQDISETAWIVTIARNLSYDWLRRRSRDAALELTPEMAEGIPGQADISSEFYFLELLRGLTDQEKDIICLRILAGLSWKEIGRVTGQSPDSQRKRYRRALEKLQRLPEHENSQHENSQQKNSEHEI